MSKTILQVLVLCLFFAGRAATQQFDPQAEQQLVQLINQERARQGVGALKLDDRLTQAARAHSALMARAKQLSHQLSGEPKLSKRVAATGIHFNDDAENVAYDYSAQEAHNGLMQSPLHRANIMNPRYNSVGVGVVRSGDVLWVTEDFARQLEDYSANDAENAVIAAFERERRRARGRSVEAARSSELRKMACAMGKKGRLDTREPLSLPHVSSALAYTESDPANLPSGAIKMAQTAAINRIAVGACFATADKYPGGAWWIVMCFF